MKINGEVLSAHGFFETFRDSDRLNFFNWKPTNAQTGTVMTYDVNRHAFKNEIPRFTFIESFFSTGNGGMFSFSIQIDSSIFAPQGVISGYASRHEPALALSYAIKALVREFENYTSELTARVDATGNDDDIKRLEMLWKYRLGMMV